MQTTIALPHPHYSSADTPHTKPPFSSASDRDALLKGKSNQYWSAS